MKGNHMKKLLIVLALLGIFQIGSTLYYESKKLNEPIVIASVVDLTNARMDVSYITNRLTPAEVQIIEISGVHYYPQPYEMNPFDTEQKFLETFANYTYYSIVSPSIQLDSERLDELNYLLQSTREATIHFNNGFTQQVTLDIHEAKEVPQLEFVSSVGNTEGSQQVMKAAEPMKLRAVEHVKGAISISYFAVKGTELTLPLQKPVEINENEELQLNVTDLFARFPGDDYLIHLHVTDKNGSEIVLPLTNTINGMPSEQWVEQKIEEREKQ